MARLFSRASDQYLTVAGYPVNTEPLTMACWFKTANITSRQYCIAIRNPSGHFWALEPRGDWGSDPLVAQTYSGGGGSSQKIGFSANTWHHGVGVFAASNHRLVYLDGSPGAADTNNSAVASIDRTQIGTIWETYDHIDGSIAEIGVWNAALTQEEVSILAAGYSPLFVRPQNLQMYLPCIRDNDEDLIGGLSFTAVNGPTVSVHPGIFYPGTRTPTHEIEGISPSASVSPSASLSPSASPSSTPSPSLSPSASESASISPSASPSPSPEAYVRQAGAYIERSGIMLTAIQAGAYVEILQTSPSPSISPSASPSPSIPPGDDNSDYSNIVCCTTLPVAEPVLPPPPPPAVTGRTHKPGLFINVEPPIFSSDLYIIHRYSEEIESYQHTHIANGGYDTCQFTLKVTQAAIDDWLENGLGRHVMVYSGETELLWEGFVNKINFGIGALSAVRGPLFDIANRVSVVYTPIIDATEDPMVTGETTETPIAEDTDSQDRYGIIEKIISGGQLLDDGTTDEAEEIRDMYLAEMKLPYTDESVNLGQLSAPTMTVECLGYKEWLKAYVYNEYDEITVTLDAKIKQVLTAEPNSIFSTDQSNIDENLLLTHKLEDTNRFANTIIEEIVAQGDSSDNRWIYRVGQDRILYYNAIPTDVKYLHSLTSSTQNLTLLDMTEVRPWNVKAGEWVEIVDFLTSESQYSASTLRENPRLLFAETVTYTAPDTLAVSGGKISSVRQRLNQLGVGGV